jgi:shikimate dehydrogenase
MSPQLFAVFGDPIAHSRSPLMHNHLFRTLGVHACYARIHLSDGALLKETFFNLGLQGANVTVPHKEAAFHACDEIRGFANETGVVNTLINEQGKLIGYNTDADGFMLAITPFSPLNTVLLIGAGGTAKALAIKLSQSGKKVTILNRSRERLSYFAERGFTTYDWDTMPDTSSYDLIINSTSAGLSDNALPAPETLLQPLLAKCRYAADVIYGKNTPFLAQAAALGKTTKDGKDMLLGQGVLANELFTQGQYPQELIQKIMAESFDF